MKLGKHGNLIDIIIPTWNLPDYLRSCVESIVKNGSSENLFHIYVVNNGTKESLDWLGDSKYVTKLEAGTNLRWEGGLKFGLENSDAPFVVFMNDDAMIPPTSSLWLNSLIQHFKNPQVAAVGPSSNTVMGWQNIFAVIPNRVYEANFLIGFCMMVRRSALEEVGGVDDSLPGGDDIDLSIRFRKAGYKILGDRNVFVFHHGFKSGERLQGNSSTPGGWNSYEMQTETDLALIKKHGLKAWWEYRKSTMTPPVEYSFKKRFEDTEGKLIKKIVKTDKVVIDLGCGSVKTVKKAIGVDIVPKGKPVGTLTGSPLSVADVVADVQEELPFKKKVADAVIARHILEHTIDPVKSISNWLKVIKKGGKLIIAVPNQDWANSIVMNVEHVHAFTPSSLTTIFNAFGLVNIKILNPGNGVSFIIMGEKI